MTVRPIVPTSIAASQGETVDVETVEAAVASVTDPEYPDVSIADLGMVERVMVVDRVAEIDLVATYAGCPALGLIAADVGAAVERVPGVQGCRVRWRSDIVWSTDRISPTARRALATDYTVTLRRKDGGLRCPACGADDVVDQSMAGPTRCRSVAWCPSCRNPIEVMR